MPKSVSGRDERGDQERVDGETRATAHQRRDEHCRQPVARIIDRPRGHDARDRAGERAEKRDERLAVKADLAHDPSHDERRAGHVPGILEKPEEEEKEEYLGEERDDGRHAGDAAVTIRSRRSPAGMASPTRAPSAVKSAV